MTFWRYLPYADFVGVSVLQKYAAKEVAWPN